MTGKGLAEYNEEVPIKCGCGRVIAIAPASKKFKICEKDKGEIFIKCHRCKRIICLCRAESFK